MRLDCGYQIRRAGCLSAVFQPELYSTFRSKAPSITYLQPRYQVSYMNQLLPFALHLFVTLYSGRVSLVAPCTGWYLTLSVWNPASGHILIHLRPFRMI